MENSKVPAELPKPIPDTTVVVKKRPFGVTLLALGVLILTVINLIRFVLSIWNWEFLSSTIGISPIYLLLTGLIWGLAGLFLVWGLWKAKTWAPRLMQAMALTYALYYWLDHIFLMEHPVSETTGGLLALLPTNWPFAIGVTLVSLIYIAWTMNRTKVKAYFNVQDRGSEPNQSNHEDEEYSTR